MMTKMKAWLLALVLVTVLLAGCGHRQRCQLECAADAYPDACLAMCEADK